MITMKPKAHKAGSTLLHVKTAARCYNLAVDLPEHSVVVEQLAYIQCGGSSILSVPIGGGTDIKPQQRSFYMTSSFTLGVFLYTFSRKKVSLSDRKTENFCR